MNAPMNNGNTPDKSDKKKLVGLVKCVLCHLQSPLLVPSEHTTCPFWEKPFKALVQHCSEIGLNLEGNCDISIIKNNFPRLKEIAAVYIKQVQKQPSLSIAIARKAEYWKSTLEPLLAATGSIVCEPLLVFSSSMRWDLSHVSWQDWQSVLTAEAVLEIRHYCLLHKKSQIPSTTFVLQLARLIMMNPRNHIIKCHQKSGGVRPMQVTKYKVLVETKEVEDKQKQPIWKWIDVATVLPLVACAMARCLIESHPTRLWNLSLSSIDFIRGALTQHMREVMTVLCTPPKILPALRKQKELDDYVFQHFLPFDRAMWLRLLCCNSATLVESCK